MCICAHAAIGQGNSIVGSADYVAHFSSSPVARQSLNDKGLLSIFLLHVSPLNEIFLSPKRLKTPFNLSMVNSKL